MRVRVGNQFHDQHGLFDPDWSFRIYEFVTHAGTNPHDVAIAIENVVPDLTVYARGSTMRQRRYDPSYTAPNGSHWIEEDVSLDGGESSKCGWANGAVWTSWREEDYEAEPALLVSIGLYNQECSNPRCMAGHMNNRQSPTVYRRAPKLADWQLDAIKEEVGEHPTYRLKRRNWEHNRGVLATLGFLPVDAPLLGIITEPQHLYTALDYLARIDEVKGSRGESGTFAYKAMELERLGYPVDPLKVQQIAQVRHLEGFLAPREPQVRDWLGVLNGSPDRE